MNCRTFNWLVLAGILLFSLALCAEVQASSSAPPISLQLSNAYISFDLGISGTVDFKIGDTAYVWDVPGRFAVVTNGGDPETTADNSLGLIAMGIDASSDTYAGGVGPCHKFGYWKVKVGNNTPSIIGISGGAWTAGPVIIDPPPGVGVGKNGEFLSGEWTTSDNIVVDIRVFLVRDQVRFEFTLQNAATTSQTVGLQMVGVPLNPLERDLFGNVTGFDAKPFVPGIGQLVYGKLLVGRNIPPVLELFDDIENPQKVARLTFSGQDATFPDRVALGEGDDLAGVLTTTDSAIDPAFWLGPTPGLPNGSYNPSVLKRVTLPAWAVCWDRKNVAVGGSRKIVAYYGVGVANGAWTSGSGTTASFDSAGLFAQGRRALDYNTTDPARVSDLEPNTFTITGYVDNFAKDLGVYDLGDVRLSLLLPDGLTLIGGSATQSIGFIPGNTEGTPVTWTVQATGEINGDLQYFVRAQDVKFGWNQLVAGTVQLPAAEKSVLGAGWQMLSVPFEFSNPDPNVVFDKLPGEIFPQFWSLGASGTGSYKPLIATQAGQGFWAFVATAAQGPFTVPATKRIFGEVGGVQTQSINIDVKPGFNMIGSPYVYPIYWGQTQVYNRSLNLALPLDQAVAQGWLSKTIFWWDPNLGKYGYSSDSAALLKPWQGYWVRALKSVTLILFPSQFPQASVRAPSGG